MVVYQNTLPAPFPASAEPSANSKPPTVSDFAYHAPPAPESFSKRFDTALQSRQSALIPPTRPPVPEAKPVDAPDNADAPQAQEDSANSDETADGNGHKPKANDRQKPETRTADTASPVAPLISVSNPAPQAVIVTVAPLVAQTVTQNIAPPTASDSKNTPPSQAIAKTANVVLPKQNTVMLTQIAPQTATAQTAPIPIIPQIAASIAKPSGNETIALNSAANTPFSAEIPQNSATASAVAAPKIPADTVDSRLVRSITTPGTDKPTSAAIPNSAATLLPDSAATAVSQIETPSNLAISGTLLAPARSVKPVSNAEIVPASAVPNGLPVKTGSAAKSPVPMASGASATVTAANTSNQLARLRTVGNAESIPAKQADVTANPALNTKPAGSVPAVPANAKFTASVPTVPSNTISAAIPSDAPQKTAGFAPASETHNTDAVTPAASGALPAAALNTTSANVLTSPAVSNPQTEPEGAFALPFVTALSAPIAAVTADTAPALVKAPTPGLTQTGANPAAGAAEMIGSEAVARQAGAGNANTDSHSEDRPADSRKYAPAATAKTGAARPELFNGANGTAAAYSADPVSPASAAPIDRTKLLDQVTQHLETLRLADGRGEISFRLAPDHLGSLQITLSAHIGGVTARVIAEHAGVRQVLEAAAGQLREALENRGLKLNSLDVTTAQSSPLDGRNAGNAQNPQQQRETLQDRAAFGRGDYRSSRSNPVLNEPALTPIAAITRAPNSRLDYRA